MTGRNRTPEHLIALFLLGAFLLLPPILVLFNQPVRVLGVPVLYLYLFFAWATLIGLTAAVTRRIDQAHDRQGKAGGASPDGLRPAESRDDA